MGKQLILVLSGKLVLFVGAVEKLMLKLKSINNILYVTTSIFNGCLIDVLYKISLFAEVKNI